jgi:hypothetical protein
MALIVVLALETAEGTADFRGYGGLTRIICENPAQSVKIRGFF